MTNKEAVENNDIVLFKAEDIDDPTWEYIINVLREHIDGFTFGYGYGNWMGFAIPKGLVPYEEEEGECLFGKGNECPDGCDDCAKCPCFDRGLI